MSTSPPLAGKNALVTGAGHRVGRAIALAVAAQGARVAVHYHGSVDGARETVAMIQRTGGAATLFQANLTEPEAPQRLTDAVTDAFGRIDLLVNSAAGMLRTPLETVTPAEWDGIFALNLRAPFFLSLTVAQSMGDAGGVIVNISDHMGFESWPGFVPHGVSKAAIAAMTHHLAAAFAPRVRVNAVAPGAVLAPAGWPDAERRRFENETPMHRVGTPEDVAAAVCYLATANYVTGETLFVDGGRRSAR